MVLSPPHPLYPMSNKYDPLEKLRLLGTFLLLELMPHHETMRRLWRVFVYIASLAAIGLWIYISTLVFK